MRKICRIILSMMVGVAAGWMVGTWQASLKRESPRQSESTHSGPTIQQVQALEALVTLRIDVADVQETQLHGYTGSIKAALLVKGDFLLGTNLSRAHFESVDRDTRTAVLALVQPQITSPRLDQEKTRMFAITETGLWQITPGGDQIDATVINHAYQDAQRLVAQSCNNPELLAHSRQLTEQLIQTFFKSTGWQVAVKWVAP